MSINYNTNLNKNNSLKVSKIYNHVRENPNVKTGDIEKALRTGGVSPSLARATAQSLKQGIEPAKSNALFEACLEDYYN